MKSQGVLSPDRKGTLEWYARHARAVSKKSITLYVPDGLVAEPEPLKDALSHTSLVIATALDSQVSYNDYFITTWRKYRLVEKLSSQPRIPDDALPAELPKALFPLARDEFIVPEAGGTIVLEGVEITMADADVKIPPRMDRHLIFSVFRSSGSIAVLNYGDISRFSIDKFGVIHPWVQANGNPLYSEVLKQASGQVSKLRVFSHQLLEHQ